MSTFSNLNVMVSRSKFGKNSDQIIAIRTVGITVEPVLSGHPRGMAK